MSNLIRDYKEDGSYIDREMTSKEIKQNQKDADLHTELLTLEENKKIQRQALLDRLGITEEEAALLMGGI